MSEQPDGGGGAKRGSIGEEIYEQVEKLMASETLSRTEAFQRISDETGRRAGTVAANYYRVARQKGAPLQKRGPRGGRKSAAGGGDASAALAKAQDALADLARVVKRQEAELQKMREEAAQVAEIKKLAKKL